MLSSVCAYIHNYFEREAFPGQYEIAAGRITPHPPIKEGQRFRIVGSTLNDGVYTFHENGIMNDDGNNVSGLQDESFTGTISSMAPPRLFISLVNEIIKWETKYGEIENQPFTHEKVEGTYSYRIDGTNWKTVFKNQLDRFRKV